MQENFDLKRDNSNEKEYKNLYSELTIILIHYQIFFQKVSIIITINILEIGIIGTLIGIIGISYLIIYFTIIIVISLLLDIYIMWPSFNNSDNKNGVKYFYNYNDLSDKKLNEYIKKNDNILEQIRINAKVLKRKYKGFKYSLILTFCFIPLLIFWIYKFLIYIIKLEDKFDDWLKIKSTWKQLKNKLRNNN